MRVTVCEIPDGAGPDDPTWQALREHVRREQADVLLLPEFAFLPAVWEHPQPDPVLWNAAMQRFRTLVDRLAQLHCGWVVGAGPAEEGDLRLNRGFAWSLASGLVPLRSKAYLPNEPGSWEGNWFKPGPREFPAFDAGELRFGLNICTELWALDAVSRYPALQVQAVATPRATGAASTERWISLARTVAVRTGAFSLSSNRRHADGSCGGVGWIIDPEGQDLARTSEREPMVTRDLDLSACEQAGTRYPRYVFAGA